MHGKFQLHVARFVLLAVAWGGWAEIQAQSPTRARTAPKAKSKAAAAKADNDQTNYGREARQETPLLWRDAESPLDEVERIHHAVSRLSFGATPELLAHVRKVGLEAWIETQLEGRQEEDTLLRERIGGFESLKLSTQEIVQTYNVPVPPLSKKLSPEQLKERAEAERMRDIPQTELKDVILLFAVSSNNQFREVACDFWRNHFNVDVSKGNVEYYATDFERQVIRGEALGTFEGMLNKQARHPAMLVYLDNYISRATPTKELMETGQRTLMQTRDYAAAMSAVDIAKMRGINENYARELMELHTLGVDNYYTQADVVTVAHALTGWTVQQDRSKPIVFEFRPDMHTSEFRLFLENRLPPAPHNPELEGQMVLTILARHPGAAEFLSYKICRHLVSDNPPPEMVQRVAKTFQQKKTDLKEVYRAVLNDPDFYNPRHYQAKFKRPLEYVVSAVRVTQAEISSTEGIHAALRVMGEPIYQCEDPTGYYDQADAWRDPGVMANRWKFALDLGMEQVRGVRIPDTYWDGLEPNNPVQWKEVLTKRILPGGCTEKTSEALDNVIAKYARFSPEPEQLGRYIVGILLGSPEFQRQ